MRALICGAGASGLLHAMCYRASGVSVVGIFDPNADRARALAELCGGGRDGRGDGRGGRATEGARVFESAGELFAIEAELASVCSPPVAHRAQAELAARASRTTFVEKPVATSRADFDAMAALPGCVPVVQWRAGRALRAVRAAIRAGMMGPAPVASADCAWSRDAAYFASGRATYAAWGCGVLLSVGVHAVDAVCWAIGRPLARASGALAHRDGIEVETSAVAHLVFEGGALASVRATFDAGFDATRLSFTGGGVTAVIEGGEVDPTASSVTWSCADDETRAKLEALERASDGGTAAPLIVPFLLQAIARVREGVRPGAHDTLPSIADTEAAHRAILDVYALCKS